MEPVAGENVDRGLEDLSAAIGLPFGSCDHARSVRPSGSTRGRTARRPAPVPCWKASAHAEQRAGPDLDVPLEQDAAGAVAVTEHDSERVGTARLAEVLDLDEEADAGNPVDRRPAGERRLVAGSRE